MSQKGRDGTPCDDPEGSYVVRLPITNESGKPIVGVKQCQKGGQTCEGLPACGVGESTPSNGGTSNNNAGTSGGKTTDTTGGDPAGTNGEGSTSPNTGGEGSTGPNTGNTGDASPNPGEAAGTNPVNADDNNANSCTDSPPVNAIDAASRGCGWK